jgi:asparagine synthase (glutamine-hydrolysing)
MKLQVGLLYRDSRQAEANDLSAILGEFGPAGWETAGQILDGSLAMAYRGNRIAVEEDSEVQPLKYGPYVLTFDGRLDNRSEILLRLNINHDLGLPDPVIVAKGYETFGDSILSALIGEFALTIWCERHRSLVFARSVCGARPLYYVLNKDELIWSSDFAHLVRVSGVDLEVNNSYVLEYLVSQPSPEHTPLQRIEVVPPNRILRFDKDRFQPPVALWNPSNIQTLNRLSDTECEELLLERLKEAVQVRMRAKSTIFSELSGGLDSSTLVLIADGLLRVANQSRESLQTLSHIYDESTSCDEQYFISSVEKARGINTHRIREQEQQVTLGLSDIEFSGVPNPLHCLPGRYTAYVKNMREYGARVLFTGSGGDHLFWSSPNAAALIADHLQAGKLKRMHQDCRTWSRVTRTPYASLIRQAFPMAFPALFPETVAGVPAWLSDTCRQHHRDRVGDSRSFTEAKGAPSSRVHLLEIESFFAQLSAGYHAEHKDIAFTFPYAHRPLVDFCLAMPTSQFLRDGQTRSIMRRAMSKTLPPMILKRNSKGAIEEVICRAIRKEWDRVGDVRHWELCQRGIANARQLSVDLTHMRLGVPVPYGNFMFAFSLERWLRSLSRQFPSTTRAYASLNVIWQCGDRPSLALPPSA